MKMEVRLAILGLLLAAAGCDEPADPQAGHAAHEGRAEPTEHDHSQHEAMEMAEPSGASVFLLTSEWTRHDGETVELSSVRGHPTVVLMFYGTCEAACPILIHDIEEIDAALGEDERARMRYLLVTFDPERDTLENLAALARDEEMDDRFALLRGDDAQIRELAMVLGIRYRETPNGEFNHSNVLTLLDAGGVVAHRLEGLNANAAPLLQRIRAMAQDG